MNLNHNCLNQQMLFKASVEWNHLDKAYNLKLLT